MHCGAEARLRMDKQTSVTAPSGPNPSAEGPSTWAPLREKVFRRIWTASLFSNFGGFFLGVGAAWEMTRLTNSPSLVALVQTALLLPMVLVTLPAGAVADMFDRRKIALAGLAFAAISAGILTLAGILEGITPTVILVCCFAIGTGISIFMPSWQASIPEQVSRPLLPSAIALGTISFNIARSFGPALAGVVVLAAGAHAVFGVTTLLYIPLLLAFFVWRREVLPSRLPPERIDRAIVGGARYALHSTPIRSALARSFLFGLATSSAIALAPLLAKDVLQGDAASYGLLLGAQGIGAVLGAPFTAYARSRYPTERLIDLCALGSAVALALMGASEQLVLTCLAFFLLGLCNIFTITLLNVDVQLSAPRWVTARALSLFGSAITAGFSIGAWMWGLVAGVHGIAAAFFASAAAAFLTWPLGRLFPLPRDAPEATSLVENTGEVPVSLPLTSRSGPVIVAVEYRVAPDDARAFYEVMTKVSGVRNRNGGFEWSLSRDIAEPELWVERFACPTWGDYLHMRDRFTQSDLQLQEQANAFIIGGEQPVVHRRLARPFGSVRWKAESPDPEGNTTQGYYGPS